MHMAHGDDQETTLRNIKDAMQLWIDTARKFGDPIPQPNGERPMFACVFSYRANGAERIHAGK